MTAKKVSFLDEILRVLIQIQCKGAIDNNDIGRRTCNKPLSESMIAYFTDVYLRHPTAMKYLLVNVLFA